MPGNNPNKNISADENRAKEAHLSNADLPVQDIASGDQDPMHGRQHAELGNLDEEEPDRFWERDDEELGDLDVDYRDYGDEADDSQDSLAADDSKDDIAMRERNNISELLEEHEEHEETER